MTFKEIFGDMSKEVYKGDFKCSTIPKLTSLGGSPKSVSGDFYCNNNPKLESLDSLLYNETEIQGKIKCDSKLQKEADEYKGNLKLFKKLGLKKYKAFKDFNNALSI